MRLKFYGSVLLLLSLATTVVHAVPPMPPSPLKNLEIAGQVLQDGKPVTGASVKAYFYNCDTKSQASATSNASGYYRLVIPSYPRLVTISRPWNKAEIAEFTKNAPNAMQRLSRRVAFETRPVPIFINTHHPTNPIATVCQQAVKGGFETPLKNRFNLKLDGIPSKAPTPPTPPKPPAKPSDQQKCAAQGGKWENLSRGVVGCNLSYKDAGRLCTDGNQCSSKVCLAKDRNPRVSEGSCAANTFSITNGCMGEIKRGHWRARACP
ncbi:MAG: carboxypeptidase-like regulatory domain-containing protein [Thiolinea sp.]